jgi:peptidoglycan/xylan/chitin deacetylase (PgdA/CDA1 family)
MTWDQVRRLAGSGMAIGSHSHDHLSLARLPEAAQRHELAESRRILEQELGREVRALAYPFGWPGTHDALTERLAREAGYRLAFSSAEGVNRPGASDAFALRRLGVGYRDSPPLFRARTALQTAFGASFL